MSESPATAKPGSYDAFMSYAREDSTGAERLRSALTGQRKTVWIDVEEIVGGAEWRARIERGIEACKAFVFILSPDSLRSQHCQQELESASRLNKLIIPVYLRDVRRPPLVAVSLGGEGIRAAQQRRPRNPAPRPAFRTGEPLRPRRLDRS